MKIVKQNPNPQPSFLGIIPKENLELLSKCALTVGLQKDDLLAFPDPDDGDGGIIENHFAIYTEEKNMDKSKALWEEYSLHVQIEDMTDGN
jgi:hypothetical protein